MKISNQNVIQDWSKISDEEMKAFGDTGDFYRQHLLNPALLKLLGGISGKTILDAGCGTGYLSRILARKGAKMTAVEPAEPLFKHAITKEQEEPLGIQYFQQDLSIFYSEQKFDAVVSNMVFMDIPEYEKAIISCINSLKQQGAFIFSISHPCFEDVGDEWENNKRLIVKEYLKEYEVKRNHGYSFHRPLSTYINLIVKNGCKIMQIVEPKLSADIALKNPTDQRDAHVPSFIVIHAIKK